MHLKLADLVACPICASVNSESIPVRGFENLWSIDLSRESLYTFMHCNSCDFFWNADYSKLVFTPENYDNYTSASHPDLPERLLAQKISSLVPSFELEPSSPLNFIEVGSGKRLGLLSGLLRLFDDATFFAVDPVLTSQSLTVNSQKTIFIKKDVSEIVLSSISFNILIFRNSAEYFSPLHLKEVFSVFLRNGGLLVTELTSINMNTQGTCHVFSEYLNIYRPSHIHRFLDECQLKSLPLETSVMHGPDRVLSIIRVLSLGEAQSTLLFDSLYDLIDCLDDHLSLPGFDAIMYGAGGRNIMALLNHFQARIHGVFDSDPRRRSSALPEPWNFMDHEAIPESWGIVLLNSSFLDSARRFFPGNLIFVLSSQ